MNGELVNVNTTLILLEPAAVHVMEATPDPAVQVGDVGIVVSAGKVNNSLSPLSKK